MLDNSRSMSMADIHTALYSLLDAMTPDDHIQFIRTGSTPVLLNSWTSNTAEIMSSIDALYAAPEFHFINNRLMLAVENIGAYWHGREYYYTVVLQIFFKPVKFSVIGIGTAIPVAGAGNYRIITGFNHEFNPKC